MTANVRKKSLFRVKFWGVRGSYPTSDAATRAYGGHTACVAVEVGGHCLIFDAGTGIIALGKTLVRSRKKAQTLNLFLSHTHHDHISGFYFFEPLFRSNGRIAIFGPRCSGKSVKKILQAAMAPEFFPVGLSQFSAQTCFYSLRGNECVQLRKGGELLHGKRKFQGASANDVEVRVLRSAAHPNGVLLYRVSHQGKSLVYATDIEQNKECHPEIIDFVRGTDVLIHDSQFLEKEYSSRKDPRRGWGHSTVERAAQVAQKAGVKQLVLFHHDPTRDDRGLKRVEKLSRQRFPSTVAAYQGLEIRF